MLVQLLNMSRSLSLNLVKAYYAVQICNNKFCHFLAKNLFTAYIWQWKELSLQHNQKHKNYG